MALVCANASAWADYDAKLVGHWIISAKEDRFGDGGTYLAMTGDGDLGLGIRCIQKQLTIGLMELGGDPKPMTEGQQFAIKFKVDKQPVVDADGIAISPRLIQVEATKSLVKAIRDGRETAVRLESAIVSSTHIYPTDGAKKAFADLIKECPIE
jgi:hypothetical protein